MKNGISKSFNDNKQIKNCITIKNRGLLKNRRFFIVVKTGKKYNFFLKMCILFYFSVCYNAVTKIMDKFYIF